MKPERSEPGQARPERLDGRGAQQVGEHLELAALLVDLELHLAAQGGEVAGWSPIRATAIGSPRSAARRSATRPRLGRGDREAGRDAGALVDDGDSRTLRAKRATTSSRKSGTSRRRGAPPGAIDVDLVERRSG